MPDKPVIVGPWQYATGGLAVALALSLAWGSRVDTLRARHKAAHAETVQRYTQAQKDAQAAFDAKIALFQAQNRRLNDAADKKVADTTIVYRDRVIRLPTAAATCDPGRADMSTHGFPQGPDGPGADAGLLDRVVIKRDDALICATNQARLEAAREWALGMMKAD